MAICCCIPETGSPEPIQKSAAHREQSVNRDKDNPSSSRSDSTPADRPGGDSEYLPHGGHHRSPYIQEGFILDVLKNYVTYDTYFKIGKKIADNPRYEKSKRILQLFHYRQ